MDIERIMEEGISRAHKLGVSEIEIFIVREASSTITVTHRGLEYAKKGDIITADIRIAINKKVTVQGAVISSKEDLFYLIEKAIAIAKSLPEDPNWTTLPRSYGYTPVYDIVDNRVRSGEINLFIEFIEEGLQITRELDKRAFTSMIEIATATIHKWVINSYINKPISYEKTSFLYNATVKAVDNGFESSYTASYLAPTLAEFNLRNLVEKATSIAISTLKSKPIESGIYNVIFSPSVFASIINTLLVPAVRADQVQKNRSPLTKKLFSKIFSEDITIIDDGAAPNMIRSAPFDDEGVSTKRKSIIDKGILLTYLYDTYTAYIDNQESTGNAIRPALGFPPMPNASNIIVIPGTQSVENIINDAKDVIIVYATIGEWLSNPVNGNLGATITNAVYYKNKEPIQGVKGVTISGNIYRLLDNDFIAITRDVELIQNILTPSIYVSNVVIGGI